MGGEGGRTQIPPARSEAVEIQRTRKIGELYHVQGTTTQLIWP